MRISGRGFHESCIEGKAIRSLYMDELHDIRLSQVREPQYCDIHRYMKLSLSAEDTQAGQPAVAPAIRNHRQLAERWTTDCSHDAKCRSYLLCMRLSYGSSELQSVAQFML